MFRRIMLVAALVATPAVVTPAQPVPHASALKQQPDTSKPKPKTAKKQAMHKKGGKTATPKAAPAQDTSKAK
jgi:hypothetical protein